MAQVLNHLGNASEIALRTLERGKADIEGNQAVWARWDASEVVKAIAVSEHCHTDGFLAKLTFGV